MNLFTLTKDSVVFAFAFVAVVFVSTSLLVGCACSKTADITKTLPAGTMLVDYYCTSKSTVGGDSYFEMVLYTTEKSEQLKLSVYSKENESEDESCTEYLVPYEAAENCYKVIKKHRLDCWNGIKNAVSLDGSLVVCKYYIDGEYIRVSTEKMPKNGEVILKNISDIMSEFISADCLIETQDTEDEL